MEGLARKGQGYPHVLQCRSTGKDGGRCWRRKGQGAQGRRGRGERLEGAGEEGCAQRSLLPPCYQAHSLCSQAAVATHALKAASSKSFAIDPLDSPHSAAVGATLANFVWNLKTTSEAKAKLEPVEISLLGDKAEPSLESEKAKEGRIQLDWETGKVYGEVRAARSFETRRLALTALASSS